jgi:hypothetical protein
METGLAGTPFNGTARNRNEVAAPKFPPRRALSSPFADRNVPPYPVICRITLPLTSVNLISRPL